MHPGLRKRVAGLGQGQAQAEHTPSAPLGVRGLVLIAPALIAGAPSAAAAAVHAASASRVDGVQQAQAPQPTPF